MTMLANIKSKVILFAIAGTFLALTHPPQPKRGRDEKSIAARSAAITFR
jgi:hypothetical protein